MASLWVGSDLDLSTLHQFRNNDRLEFRLACLHNKKTVCQEHMSRKLSACEERSSFEDLEDEQRRRRRSGTWP